MLEWWFSHTLVPFVALLYLLALCQTIVYSLSDLCYPLKHLYQSLVSPQSDWSNLCQHFINHLSGLCQSLVNHHSDLSDLSTPCQFLSDLSIPCQPSVRLVRPLSIPCQPESDLSNPCQHLILSSVCQTSEPVLHFSVLCCLRLILRWDLQAWYYFPLVL